MELYLYEELAAIMNTEEKVLVLSALALILSAALTRILPVITWVIIFLVKKVKKGGRTMKKFFVLTAILLVLAGCGAYRNEAQYARGDWDLWMGPERVSRVLEDKLALEKLKALPANTKTVNGVSMGYKGVVYNSRLRKFTVKIYGPENKEYYVGREQEVTDYLIAGTYKYQLFFRGRKYGPVKTFTVSAQLQNFLGRNVHWMVIIE